MKKTILITVLIFLIVPLFADAEDKEDGDEQDQPEIALPDVYIEVNIPAMELSLYEGGVVKFAKPIAIGSGVYPTPEQESLIKKIEWNPWWYPPNSKWAAGEKPTPPSPGNPLGVVKMPLSEAILFHGTNKRSSIGRAASHGCMRMLNEDAEELAWYLQSTFSEKKDPSLLESYKKNRRSTFVVYLDVPVQVRLVYKPIAVKGDRLFFYKDVYGRLKNKKTEAILAEMAKMAVPSACIDDEKISELALIWPQDPEGTPYHTLLKPENEGCVIHVPAKSGW